MEARASSAGRRHIALLADSVVGCLKSQGEPFGPLPCKEALDLLLLPFHSCDPWNTPVRFTEQKSTWFFSHNARTHRGGGSYAASCGVICYT